LSENSGDIEDDPSIPDDEKLYRRINPDWVLRDGSLASTAFRNLKDDALSVRIASKIPQDEDSSPLGSVAQFPGYSVAVISAGDCRALGQGVIHEPDLENGDDAHGHVLGKKNKRIQKRLRDAATLYLCDQGDG